MNENLIKKEPSHHLIVESANWSEIIKARKEGVAWDEIKTREGMSALGMAIFEGSAVAAQILLEMGIPIKTEKLYSGTWFSPLWYALEKKRTAILELLLEWGADANEEHPEYGTPILYASENKMMRETIILCKHGANPNTKKQPSPLWLWIKHTKPYKDEANPNFYNLPDTLPILTILNSGVKINIGQTDSNKSGWGDIGMNEIEFAKKHWMCDKLKKEDVHTAMMLISIMERNMLKGSGQIQTSNTYNQHKI